MCVGGCVCVSLSGIRICLAPGGLPIGLDGKHEKLLTPMAYKSYIVNTAVTVYKFDSLTIYCYLSNYFSQG